MELHALDRELPVAQAHNYARAVGLAGPGADFKVTRQPFLADDQRVITGRCHRRVDSLKNCPPIVLDRARFSVHQVSRAHHFSSKSRADGLMSQADPEQRNHVLRLAREVTNQFDADPSVLRSARSRRNHDALRSHRFDLVDADLVVTPHLNLRAQFADVLDEVVSERIVIVEDEDHVLILNAEFLLLTNGMYGGLSGKTSGRPT